MAEGRHREAIAAFQQSLEVTRSLLCGGAPAPGEAYQALAKVSAGSEERAVREEYLKKFKEDALLASGSLFDLGHAYETNGIWKH